MTELFQSRDYQKNKTVKPYPAVLYKVLPTA